MAAGKRRTAQQDRAALIDWPALNKALRNLSKADDVKRLLGVEQRNKARKTFMMRIHARLNRLRAEEERAALR